MKLSLILKESIIPGQGITKEQLAGGKAALNFYLRDIDRIYSPGSGNKLLSRYDITLERAKDGYGEVIYTFRYISKGGHFHKSEFSSYNNRKLYRSAKDAIDAIPKESKSAYRGISFEEFKSIKTSGYVKSSGVLNLGSAQEGYTFFGDDPGTGVFYASSFQPIYSGITRGKPAFVIEVSRSELTQASLIIDPETQRKVGTSEEFVTDKPISKDKILNLYMLMPVNSSAGVIEIIFDKWRKKYREGSRMGHSTKYEIVLRNDLL